MAKNSARSAAAALLDGLYHRASTRPDDTAVSAGGRSFSWWRLLDCARSVDLRRVPPGVILIDCGRTPQAVAAITACVESGHPFLLADDDFPEERQAAVREDCSPVGTLSVHADHEICFTPSSSAIERTAKAEGLYWIYTSGSTGVPKATVVPAKAIVALLPALRERVPELADARCLGVTASFGFDPALQQIFLALHGGMTLAIPSDNVRRAPDALLDFWSAQGVDVADGTPLLLRSLTRLPEHRMTPLSPRCLLIGGDMLRPQDVTTLWDRYGPDVSVYNLYGVAECGIDSVVGKVEPEHVESPELLAVGTELVHSEVLLLGEDREPVPPGELGEICIGGIGVGLGYPMQPDETNRSLIVLDGYGRLYRTGDLGRRLKDGRLLVTGRTDRQVKMAGRRVEPAEIEAAVLRWVREQAAESDRMLGPQPHVRRCRECVLSEHYPGNGIDESGLCRYCRIPADEVRSGWGYFRQIESLEDALDRARAAKPGDYDALLLFSGGKDSSYVLYRLLDFGAKIVAFTFDNGFISDAAFENIERMCAETGVPHHYGHAKDGAGLLAESLRADATVCSGCFVGITATGAALAAELGCRFVVSGLSRGQIIDTKLLQFVRRGRTDLGDIDRELHEHRRLYLKRRDAFARAVGQAPHGDDHGADVENLDYFRYDSVGVHDIHGYLGDRDARWRSPKDTGVCSTNCRANDAGIAEHLTERGYHSYEGPLSWEVRLGKLSRDEALAKVEARADERNVVLVHERLGRRTDVAVVARDGGLAAFVEGHLPGGPEALRSWLGSRLPWYMVPGRIQHLPAGLPRLPNNKIDYTALRATPAAAPEPPDETQDDELTAGLRAAWAEVLSRAPASDTDHFFHLGGDSLAATDLASVVERHTKVSVPIIAIFESPEFGTYREAVRECTPAPRKEAPRSAALGVQIRRIVHGSATEDAATIFLMPDAAGGPASLLKLFATAAHGLPVNLMAVSHSAENWPERVTIESLTAEMAAATVQHLNGRRVALVGWSLGATLAAHTANAFAAELRGRQSPPELECWLLDPPRTGSADALELREEIAEGLRKEFPQFSATLRGRDDWSRILSVINRARRYRDGGSRILRAQPDFVRRSVHADAATEHLLPALITTIRTLAVISDDQSPPPHSENVTVRRFGPEHGDDHWSMIDAERAPFYAPMIAELCAAGPSSGRAGTAPAPPT